MSKYDLVQEKVREVQHKMQAVGLAELASLIYLLDEGQKEKLDRIMKGKEMNEETILHAVRLSASSVIGNLDKIGKTFFSIR